MQLDKRQKILVGILVGLPVLYWGATTLWEVVYGPFSSRYELLASANERLDQKLNAQTKLERDAWRLRDADRRSLPSDPSSLAYQVWLTDLAEKHEFKSLSVLPKPAVRNSNEPFSRIRFSITAHCEMKELCQFLFDFYRTDLLHKVTNLTVKSLSFKDNPELDILLDIEGLSMKTTKKRDSLFEEKQEQAVSSAMKKKDFADYETLYTQNRFVRGYNGPPKSILPPPPPVAPFDSSTDTKLVGVSESEGVSKGWLRDYTSNQEAELYLNQDFEIGAVKGKVMAFGSDWVNLKIKDKTWRIELGKSLKEMKEVGTDGKPILSPNPQAGATQPGATTVPPSTGTAVSAPVVPAEASKGAEPVVPNTPTASPSSSDRPQ